MNVLNSKSSFIESELDWLEKLIQQRIQDHFQLPSDAPPSPIESPNPVATRSKYEAVVKQLNLTDDERVAIALAISPILRPTLLDLFFLQNSAINRNFTEFGGVKSSESFLPTGQTLLFVLAGTDIPERIQTIGFFGADHSFAKHSILSLAAYGSDTTKPNLDSQLVLNKSFLKETFGLSFAEPNNGPPPAQRLQTVLEWEDAVYAKETSSKLADVLDWLNYGGALNEASSGHLANCQGFTVLFHGPPGTGKTIAASLLGKSTELPVYRIDLSLMVSKWIGETEKNLSLIFEKAKENRWIIFFDEADALFGKRVTTTNANDRFANQGVSYLLQRIEFHPGLVILATNLIENIDTAFMRRIQTIVKFPIPCAEERFTIWQKLKPDEFEYHPDIDLAEVSKKYEIPAGVIINVVRYCAIKALKQQSNVFSESVFQQGLRNELEKQGFFL